MNVIHTVCAGKRCVPLTVGETPDSRTELCVLRDCALKVLKLLVDGKSNRSAVSELVTGENTVRFHVNHSLRKLDARDHSAAVVTALCSGLVKL